MFSMYELLPHTQPIHSLDYMNVTFTTLLTTYIPQKIVQGWGKLPHHQQTGPSSNMDGYSDKRNLKSGVC